jgi:enoyl-CoA hydratase/carnithine racemase
MLSDLCVATEDARFWYPEPRLGFSGGLLAGLAGRLPHKVAMELLLTDEIMPAQRAFDVGFVNKLVPAGEHLTEGLRLATRLAGQAPMAMRLIKRFVGMTLPVGPVEKSAARNLEVDIVMNSLDRSEGLKAFAEGRPPQFIGS